MTKGTKKYCIYLLLIASIGIASNHAPGFVHCQSDDGHDSLELMANACCHAETINRSHQITSDSCGTTYFTKRDGCGPCVDTIISFYAVNTPKKPTSSLSGVAAAPGFLNIISGCSRSSEPVSHTRTPFPVNPSLLSIRTIILLA